MAYFYDSFMEHRRKQWLRSIHAVEAQVGAAWHRGTINKKTIEGDTLVILATFPTLDAVECTISAVQSRRPPNPTSMMATSTPSVAK